MHATTAIFYTHSLLKDAGGVGKVLEEFACDLVSDGCSAILDVNYTVNGSPFLQRDMHPLHPKRKPHPAHSLFGASFKGGGFTKVLFYQTVPFYNFDQGTFYKIAKFYKIAPFDI